MIRKFQLAALVAAAFFLSTVAAAQKRDPSAWMHEIGPVAGIYGFFGAESGADAFYGLDYSHSYWNGLGFRTGFRYMLECCNVGDVVSVPLAFSWRSRLRTEPERLAGGVAGLSPYGFHDTPSAGTVLGAFLLNLFSRFEVYAGVTPGYVFGKSNIYRHEFRGGYVEEGVRLDRPFTLSVDAGIALSYRIWRFNLRLAPAVHYNLTDNYHLWSAEHSDADRIDRHSDKSIPWAASLDFGLLWLF